MATNWPTTTLGDHIDIRHGFAFQGEFFRDEPPGDVLLTPGNFAIGGGYKGDRLKYYVGPVPPEFVLDAGDLLVTMTDLSKNADTLGFPARVPNDSIKYLHNQRLGKVLFRPDAAIDKRFLYYLFCTREYRHEVVASATGTTVKHTSPSRIRAFKFGLPTLWEQKRIAEVLGALDDKIELNRRISETLESMARTLFKSWFVDFDPVRARVVGLDPGLPNAVAGSFPEKMTEAAGGETPDGWSRVPMDSIARFLNGLALQKYPPTGDVSLPVVKIAQLRSGSVVGADLASAAIPADYVVEDGDVLFSWSGSLECTMWTAGRGALNQHLFKVTSHEYPKWYYYLAIHQHLDEFRRIAAAKATTMGHIQRHHLSEAMVAVPPKGLLKVADEVMAPLIDRMVACRLESRQLAHIRDALLPKLISGDVRVPISGREG